MSLLYLALTDTSKLENMLGNNFSKLCRCCMRNGQFNIFSTSFDSKPIATLLQQLVTEQISPTDELPKIICDQCLNIIISHFLFSKNYQTVQVLLRRIFEENASDEKPVIINFPENLSVMNDSNSTYNDRLSNLPENCKKGETVFSPVTTFELNHLESENETQNDITSNYELFEMPQKNDNNKSNFEPDERGKLRIEKVFTEENPLDGEEIYNVSSEKNVNLIPDHMDYCKSYNENDNNERRKKKHSKCSTEILKNKMHTCDVCGRRFRFVKYLRKHCTDTGHLFPRRHTCEICQKKFTSNSYLQDHLKLHKKEHPFKCDECGAAFTLKSYLTNHKKIHTGRVPLICEVCGKAYTKKYTLMLHMRIHNEAPYKCEYCGKNFYRKYSLVYHLYSCHGKNPEEGEIGKSPLLKECEICKKSYSRPAYYTHMQTKHGDKCLCNICGKTLASKPALDTHMNTHTKLRSYNCKICSKSYADRSTLRSHMLVHSGERRFRCDICGAAFKQSPHLATHLKCHTGVKPYCCTFCKRRFASKGNMTVHMRKHTGVTPHHCRICNKGFFDTSSRKRHEVGVHKLHSQKNNDNSGVDRGKKRPFSKNVIVEKVPSIEEESNS